MQNILLVLYNDFHSQSAIHVHHFANNLIAQGLDCVVCVPRDKHTVALLQNTSYKVAEFSDIYYLKDFFHNGKDPDIVHAWTPREVNRIYCAQLKLIYNFKLVIHLEDNEEYILEKDINKPFKEILASIDSIEIPERLSHPKLYREFLASADGVTVIIDNLKEFVPDGVPSLTLWPGADTKHFFVRRKNLQFAESFGIPKDSIIFCYTGNVHAGNKHEVRSIYLAVALMNREGLPAVLIRTGMDTCELLGEGDQWLKKHSIELGYIDYNRMPDIMALADFLIQPGRPDKFNDYRFPSKLPEFLAMGKPVILPDTNIAQMMEHKKDAFILPVVDAANIVDAVKLIFKDRKLYEKLSLGAVNFARNNLNWQTNSESLKSFYEDIWSEKVTIQSRSLELQDPPPTNKLIEGKIPQIETIQPSLTETADELENTNAQLPQTQTEVENTHAQLRQTQGELEQTKMQRHQIQEKLAILQSQFHAIEAEQEQFSLVPTRLLEPESKQFLIERYAKPSSYKAMSYATARDFCDSADYLPQLCKLNGDLKNVQRPWIVKEILSQVPLGSKLLEIGGGIPVVAGFLTELGYDVTIVDPYQGAGNGPIEYEKYTQQYPSVKIIRSLFEPKLQGVNPASIDCIFSISVLEHIWGEALQDVYRGIRKFLRPQGKSIHCVDHVLRGAGAEGHDENLKVILLNQLQLQNSAYPIGNFEDEYKRMIGRLKYDLETYYLSAEGHNFWRGGVAYDVFPFRKVVSIETCVSMS
ncbi:glycosyltransferase [Microcoleus sp. herbarium19]|uniref:glycosyltransferase n=1 Tax=unclassified Microcoleus TaxID=2642155 RepID=UPI002FD24799